MQSVADSKIMFVTGVVGRAMGSGQFKAADIEGLTSSALQAFEMHLWPALEKSSPAPAQSVQRPAGSPAPYAPPAPDPFRGQGGVVSGEAGGKPFAVWKDDRIGLGKKESPVNGKTWGEVTWAEAYRLCAAGNAQASKYLSWISETYDPGTDPKWAAKNNAMKLRAACVLQMAKKGQVPAEPEYDPFPS